MPSNRLAFLSVAVGSALLGWATAGVSAIGADLPKTPVPAQTQQQTQTSTPPQPDVEGHLHRHGHHGRSGV